jgi:hypothetical protein
MSIVTLSDSSHFAFKRLEAYSVEEPEPEPEIETAKHAMPPLECHSGRSGPPHAIGGVVSQLAAKPDC